MDGNSIYTNQFLQKINCPTGTEQHLSKEIKEEQEEKEEKKKEVSEGQNPLLITQANAWVGKEEEEEEDYFGM